LDTIGEPHISQRAGEQGHGAAVLDRLQLPGVTGQDHLGAALFGQADEVSQVGVGIIEDSSTSSSVSSATSSRPRAPR
jgi:hypothetical protein